MDPRDQDLQPDLEADGFERGFMALLDRRCTAWLRNTMSPSNPKNDALREVWAPVAGYEGDYIVSNMGLIFSLKSQRHLKASIGSTGYWMCSLSKAGKCSTLKVHRVVYASHRGPIPSGLDVAHLNGKRLDPRLSNLACVSRKENCFHKVLHKTDQSGERASCVRLNWEKVDELRLRYQNGERIPDLVAETGICNTSIYNMLKYKTWKLEKR